MFPTVSSGQSTEHEILAKTIDPRFSLTQVIDIVITRTGESAPLLVRTHDWCALLLTPQPIPLVRHYLGSQLLVNASQHVKHCGGGQGRGHTRRGLRVSSHFGISSDSICIMSR